MKIKYEFYSCLAFVLAVVLVMAVSARKMQDNRQAVVVAVEGDEVIVETEDGNQFSFYGSDFKVGSSCTLKFNNHGTATVEDDEIVDAYEN